MKWDRDIYKLDLSCFQDFYYLVCIFYLFKLVCKKGNSMEVLALHIHRRYHHILYTSLDFKMLHQIFLSYNTDIIPHINHMDLPKFNFKQQIIYLRLSLISFWSLLVIKGWSDMDDDYNNLDHGMENSSQPSWEQTGSLSNRVSLIHNSLELLDVKISRFHLDVKTVL